MNITIDDLCKILGVESPEKYMETMAIWDNDFPRDMTESDIDEEICRLESEEYARYVSAVLYVASKLFGAHGLDLSYSSGDSEATIEPLESWETVARELIETINGAGPFFYASIDQLISDNACSGAKQVALQHLHWVKEYPEVYGDPSIERQMDLYLNR